MLINYLYNVLDTEGQIRSENMKKSKWIVMIVSVAYLFFLESCKQSSSPVVASEKIDKIIILVKDSEGEAKKWEAIDPNFIKTVIANVNLLFEKSDKNAQHYDMELTKEQKNLEYQLKLYKKNAIVQEIQIEQGNKVTVDEEKFSIEEDKEQELDSLKNHLLLVVK